MKLQGIFSPITTPFNHEGELWKVKVQHNIEKWNATGLSGYVVVASTGESVMLGTDEKIQLWEWVAQWAAPEKLLIAGTGMDSVHQTVALTNRAADIGYKAALVKTPSFFKGQFAKSEAQMLFFRAVADQAKIPVLLYNFPQNTGIDLAAEAVAELSHHPNIIGIKESSGNVEKLMQMVRESKKGFQVLTGSATTLAPSLAIGCTGGILAFANPAPYATISIWEAHRTREPEAALDWQNRIGHAAKLVTTKYGVGGLKYAMDLTGYYGGPPRLPLTVPTPAAKQEIEEAFADLRG
jgi:4-hydroxy-2-oxoglutarate aldolase